ncbi:MAG: hypothetical protein HGA47_13180, partial [Zoogloea sp.]|nr:hypothetical protein [Zoogloea sp.]
CGRADDEAGLYELAENPPARKFDLDTYRILARWLDNPAALQTVTPLPAR